MAEPGDLRVRARLAWQLLRPRRYLLVMSHMRSYSSLLCHILNSNPAVAGYVETHRSYLDPTALAELRLRVCATNGGMGGRYVLDKVLHNRAEVAPEILARDDVSAIFLLRAPRPTIASTVAMERDHPNRPWMGKPGKVAAYYVRRVAHLAELAAHAPRSVLVAAERLVDDPDATLAGLTTALGLRTPLSQHYDTFAHTGEVGYGDPTGAITSGRVVAERDDHAEIEIPPDALERAEAAYAESRALLADRCEVAIT